MPAAHHDPEAATPSGFWRRPLLFLAPLLLVLIGGTLFPSAGRDDAHIGYWVADGLAKFGRIINYNGEPIEQSSTLLHALVLAGAHRLLGGSVDMVLLGRLSAIIFGVLAVVAAQRLAARIQPPARPGGRAAHRDVGLFCLLVLRRVGRNALRAARPRRDLRLRRARPPDPAVERPLFQPGPLPGRRECRDAVRAGAAGAGASVHPPAARRRRRAARARPLGSIRQQRRRGGRAGAGPAPPGARRDSRARHRRGFPVALADVWQPFPAAGEREVGQLFGAHREGPACAISART